MNLKLQPMVSTAPFDYDKAFRMVASTGKRLYGHDFVIDDIDRPVVRQFFAYMRGAEEENIDPQKGLMLAGVVGCGKTALMRIIAEICRGPYKPVIKSCSDICVDFGTHENGYDIIKKYRHIQAGKVPPIYCFDDLGAELPVSFYGVKVNVMAEILKARYEVFVSHRVPTYVTTQLNGAELELRYGSTLRSRMRAMFNLIAFDPTSRNKYR